MEDGDPARTFRRQQQAALSTRGHLCPVIPSPGDKLSRLQGPKFLFSSVSIISQSYSELVRFPQLSAVFHSEVPAHFCRPPGVIS